MAKHRAPRPLRRIVPAVMALLLGASLAVAVPASANSPTTFDQLHLVKQNSIEKFNCNFDVQRVDTNTGAVTATLQGNAFPASLIGYFNIAHNQVNCTLYNNTGTVLLATINASADHPKVTTGTVTVVVPYDIAYTLCGAAAAVLNNGNTSGVAGCIHG